jgi:hypothetical protein
LWRKVYKIVILPTFLSILWRKVYKNRNIANIQLHYILLLTWTTFISLIEKMIFITFVPSQLFSEKNMKRRTLSFHLSLSHSINVSP